MKIKTIFTWLICIFLFSKCNLEQANKTTTDENNIPEVFEYKSTYDWNSYRGEGNLVEVLFDEYLKKDNQLKSKLENYQNTLEQLKEKTDKYRVYQSNIENYYSSVSNYINYINDTLVKKSTEEKITVAKQEQFELSEEQAAKYRELQDLQNEIEELINRIKIEKTLQIMREYQRQVPTVAAENLEKPLDSLRQSLKNEL